MATCLYLALRPFCLHKKPLPSHSKSTGHGYEAEDEEEAIFNDDTSINSQNSTLINERPAIITPGSPTVHTPTITSTTATSPPFIPVTIRSQGRGGPFVGYCKSNQLIEKNAEPRRGVSCVQVEHMPRDNVEEDEFSMAYFEEPLNPITIYCEGGGVLVHIPSTLGPDELKKWVNDALDAINQGPELTWLQYMENKGSVYVAYFVFDCKKEAEFVNAECREWTIKKGQFSSLSEVLDEYLFPQSALENRRGWQQSTEWATVKGSGMKTVSDSGKHNVCSITYHSNKEILVDQSQGKKEEICSNGGCRGANQLIDLIST